MVSLEHQVGLCVGYRIAQFFCPMFMTIFIEPMVIFTYHFAKINSKVTGLGKIFVQWNISALWFNVCSILLGKLIPVLRKHNLIQRCIESPLHLFFNCQISSVDSS